MANFFKLEKRFDLAYFVSIVNDWWDVMDSGVPNHRYNMNKCGLGVNWEQQEYSLKRMLALAENMVIGPVKTARKERVAFQKGIIVSINSVLALWAELKEEGCKYLLTRKLNQDCLENFFSAVRSLGGPDTNPNSVQFCTRVRILKTRRNLDTVIDIVKDKNTHVEVEDVDDRSSEELFVSSEIGIKDELVLD